MMMNRVDQRLQYLQKRQAPRRLQPYSIFTRALARHAVQNENIGDAAVDNGKLADDSVDNSKMQLDSITADNIVANTITATEIAANTITADEIMAGTITADEIAVGTITATQIAANTITGDEITAGVKLSAPVVYGGGMRAYDVINPDPATYIGTVPPVPYVAVAGATWSGGTPTIKSQITCSSNGTISLFANAGIDWVNINGDIVATRPWVNANYSGSGHGHGSHTHSYTDNGAGMTTGSASVSDERLKTDIQPLDIGLALIEALEPVKFKFINGDGGLIGDEHGMVQIPEDGSEVETRFRPGVRTHYGLIAQQARAATETVTDDDFAGWLRTEDDVQMLRYDEFIAPLIKAVQELSAQNKHLAAEVAELKAKLQ